MKNAETAEKAYRSSDYFYEREKEKAGYVLEEARKGLSIIERRQAAQACKMLIEEQKRELIEKFGLPKNRDDWDKDTAQTAEHIFRQGIAEATIRGAVLKIVAKSDVQPLITGQRLPYDAKMAKRARHDGGTYFWALTVLMEDRESGISTEKDTHYEKSRVYTSADRRKIQQRARKLLKKYAFAKILGGSVYRPVVASFLPMDTFKLYMAMPQLEVAEEHIQQALAEAKKAGAGYAELVESYRAGDFGSGLAIVIPNFASTAHCTFDGYLQSFLKEHEPNESLQDFSIYTTDPRTDTFHGLVMRVSADADVHFPAYTETLEKVIYRLTDAGFDTDVYTDEKKAIIYISWGMKKRGEVFITSAGYKVDAESKKLTDTISSILNGADFTSEEIDELVTEGQAQGIPEYLKADTDYVLEVLGMCKEVESVDTTYYEGSDDVIVRALNEDGDPIAIIKVGIYGVDKKRVSHAVKRAFRQHEYTYGY